MKGRTSVSEGARNVPGRARRAALLVLAAFLCLALPRTVPAGQTKVREKKCATYDEFSDAVTGMVGTYNARVLKSSAADQEYGTARLALKGGNGVDFSQYGPLEILSGPEGLRLIQFRTAAEAKEACEKLKRQSRVEWVEPDRLVRLDPVELKSAPAAAASSGSLSWGVSRIGADVFAKKLAATPRTVKVAVIDTGVSSHPFLRGRIVPGHDFVDGDADASDDETGTGHGTHVAGTIVDCTPGLRVMIMPLRSLDGQGDGDGAVLAQAVRYAARNGAKIINMSLTGFHMKQVDEAVKYAVGKGCVVVCAAGNFDRDTADWCPAHLSEAIVVGAVNRGFNRVDYSDYGWSLDVTAPGYGIRSCNIHGGTIYMSGTSMATPHVAAVAAMLKMAHPSATPARIEALIKSRAKDRGAAGRDRYYGYGVVQAGAFNTVKPSGVKLSASSLTLAAGSASVLSAAVTPYDASDKSLTWTSSDSAVASVNSSGKVTAKKAGRAVITARTVNGHIARCSVTVRK